MSFNIKNRPGCISKEKMRQYFEKAINDTALLRSKISIETKDDHYLNPDTDTMWTGFALGMRCAERLSGKVAVKEAIGRGIAPFYDHEETDFTADEVYHAILEEVNKLSI